MADTPITAAPFNWIDPASIPRRQRNWGGWEIDGAELSFPAYRGGGRYPIDLRGFTSSAQILDTIAQVAGKGWATPACVSGLVWALDDIFSLQGRFCSGGSDMRPSKDEIRRLIEAWRS